jgi:3-hydroxypropanoate dehydrogenase
MSVDSEELIRRAFLDARTHSHWVEEPVEHETLRRIYELARMAPTAANCQPTRMVFVQSEAAKQRLRPCLAPGNVEQTMRAPVTAIVAYDSAFYDKMPRLFPPVADMGSKLRSLPEEAREFMLLQNGSLQAAYVILAARMLGLDCGPMAGFDRAKVDAAFFEHVPWRSILLINLGHGDQAKLHPRLPRLEFEDACRIE